MAVLKDLIVHGRSRFVNGAQFNTINAESIGATQGIFNELIATTLEAKNATIDDLTANNATVVGLLDVQGELHTNSWTNANIANIGGSFYISPTVEPTDGSTTISITRNSATSWTISAAGTFATDFVKSDKATAGVTWPANSLVLITGDVVVGDMVYPLGTLKGTLSAAVIASAATTSKTITLTGVTDAQNNNSPSVLQQLYEINNNQNISGAAFKNGKISLYKLGSYPIGILMTSMGTNSNSLIDIYGGVSTNPNVRIGHLGSLESYTDSAGNTRQPTGWGIYTDNGYFKGVIVADSGSIGKFTINSKAIYSGTHDTWNKAATGIYIGDDYISFGSGGVTYFNNSGTGKVGPWTLTTTALYNTKSSYNNANAGVYIGTDYIAGGAGEKWWLKSDGSAKIGAMTLTKEGVLTVPAANVSGALTAATLSVNQLTSGTISTDILNSNNIVTDTITMGTAGSNAYIYVSKNNKSATINSESKSWRIILGNTFGVTETGYLSASSGKIGGWTIGTNDLSTGSVGTASGIKFSNSTFDASINGATRSNLMFSIGSKFGVDKDGNLYASGANITGITTDTITGGTAGSQHFVYLSTNDYGTAITVGPGTSMSDWKLIVGNRFGVDSYGNLFANKAILTEATVSGKITANSGYIGGTTGFIIDGTAIRSYDKASDSATSHSITLSRTSFTRSINGASKSTLVFAIGNTFGVDYDGWLYASHVEVEGKITATSGTIGAASAINKIQIGTDTTDASIYYGMDSLDSSENGFYIGTDGISVGGGKFKVTAAGAITATGLTITGYATTADNEDAKKTALSYLYYKDATSGLYIAKSVNQSTAPTSNYVQLTSSSVIVANTSSNRAEITSGGMQVYISNNKVANFGSTITLGLETTGKKNIYIEDASFKFRNGTTTLAEMKPITGYNGFNLGNDYNYFSMGRSGDSSTSNASLRGVINATSSKTASFVLSSTNVYDEYESNRAEFLLQNCNFATASGYRVFLNGLTYFGNGAYSDYAFHFTGEKGIYSEDQDGYLCRNYIVSNADTTALGNTAHKTYIYGECHIYNNGYYHGTWAKNSDIRLKNVVKELGEETDNVILNLKPFEYTLKDREDDPDREHDDIVYFGVSAQEVRKVFEENGIDPDEHSTVSKDGEYYSVDYNDFIPMLIHLCQSQQKKIDNLEERLSKLEGKFELI